MELQTLLRERAMVSLDKAILLWVMWIADEHSDSEGLAKTNEGGRKVTALRSSDPPGVAVQRDGGREAMFSKRLGDSRQSRLCCKVGANMMSQQNRGALIDDIEGFYHMLLFAVRISRDAGGVFEIKLPLLHRWGTFDRISNRREARGNAPIFV